MTFKAATEDDYDDDDEVTRYLAWYLAEYVASVADGDTLPTGSELYKKIKQFYKELP